MSETTSCPECGAVQRAAAYFCEKCGEPLFEGKTAGVYKITNRIGAGGMGAVYRAEHTKLGTPFAVKILHRQYAKKSDLVARFVTEAKATSRLRHEHIVFITDFGELDRMGPYIAMEFLDGMPLKDALTPGMPFPIERALVIGSQLADTMAYAHEQGIVHRDLKPDNVFLVERKHNSEDFIKVLDFGIAKLVQDGDAPTLTKTGAVIGTPAYMSPEQALGQPLDYRSDIYSYGIILFEMLTGHVPFEGTTAYELIEKRVFRPAPKVSEFAPQWSGSPVETLVELCLQRQPDDRIQSMGDIKLRLKRLEVWQKGLPPSAKAQATQIPLEPPKRQQEASTAPEFDETSVGELIRPPKSETRAYGAETSSGSAGSEVSEKGAEALERTPAQAGSLPTGVPGSSTPAEGQAYVLPASHANSLVLGVLGVLLLSVTALGSLFVFGLFRQPATPSSPHTPVRATPHSRVALGSRRPAPLFVPAQPGTRDAAPAVAARPVARVVPRVRRVLRRRRSRVGRRRRRRLRRRRVVRPPVLPRVRPQARPAAPRTPAIGANGCPVNQGKMTWIRIYANYNQAILRAHKSASRLASGTIQKRSPRGKGWCVPLKGPSTWVRLFAESFEHADCWFKVDRLGRRIIRVKLKPLEEQGPQEGYCLR